MPVYSTALFRRIAVMALLAGVLIVLVSCGAVDYWPISTWINETHVPVYVTVNNNGTTILRPQEKESFPGGFYAKGDVKGPASYVVRAYEFLPGKGEIPGWYDEAASRRVYGGRGDLLFYTTYPQEEIEAMNYTVTITQNVFPGQSPPGSLP